MQRISLRRHPRTILIVFAGLLGVLAVPLFAAAASTDPDPVAFIDKISPPNTQFSEIGEIERHGGRDPGLINNHFALLPGNEVVVRRPGAVIVVRDLATNTPVAVTTDSPDHKYTVPKPAVPGLGGALAWFVGALQGVDQAGDSSAMVASRAVKGPCYNETGETNKPTEFRIPILVASRSVIAAGNRAIFVSWQGGAPPFSLTLSAAETGKTVAQSANIRGACATFLPRTELRSGHYRLTLIDSHNVKEQEDSLFVVNAAPGEPRELRDANLPEDARKIYAATWLAAQDHGTWAFEAQQRVATMDCRSPAVQKWLAQWGSSTPCTEANH